MGFLTEPVPPRGTALDVAQGIRRIVADNPGVMTYHGTNTYLVDGENGLTVVDPGPEDEAHVRDILAAAGTRPINLILLTHTHADHCGAGAALAAATGAPIAGFETPAKEDFAPNIKLADGGQIAGFTAVHTPGHAADHLCFAFHGADGSKILFSGDHVMSWSSSIVSPPDGDMTDYYRSLELVLARDDDLFLPGHGPKLPQPRVLSAALLANRQMREKAILNTLGKQERSIAEIAAQLYHKSDLYLRIAAQRNVLAHLLKLKKERIVTELEPAGTIHKDNLELGALLERSNYSSDGVARQQRDSQRRFGLTASV